MKTHGKTVPPPVMEADERGAEVSGNGNHRTGGWETRPLGEVCDLKPSKSEAKARLSGKDLVSFVPMQDLGIGLKYFSGGQQKQFGKVAGSYTYFREGDVILAKITPCFENGKLGIARNLTNKIGFGSSEFTVLRVRDEIAADFLFYYLSRAAFRNEGIKFMSGAVGHKRLPNGFLQNYEIPVPPLPEQKRIVAVLDEAFEGIATAAAHAERNLHNARELFQSVLQSTFEQKGEDWVETKLGEVVSVQNGFAFKSKDYCDDGHFVMRIGNVQDGFISLDNPRFVRPDNKSKRFILRESDILISLTGNIGRAGWVGPEHLPAVLNQRVARVVPRSAETLESKFLFRFFTSEAFRLQLSGGGHGSAQQNVSAKEIAEIAFNFPPQGIQRDIVQNLDALDAEARRLEAIYERKLAALEELKQSLLERAFSGKL